MIRLCGIDFLDYEQEVVTPDTILNCHPQKTLGESLGVPLRVTNGYQCVYDKLLRTFAGLIFYSPPDMTYALRPGQYDFKGKPHDQFSYVLASFDGKLTKINDGVVLSDGTKALIYSHFSPSRTSGNVKKGAIIGRVGEIPGGLGYGVSIRGFKNGQVWNLQADIQNIPCIE